MARLNKLDCEYTLEEAKNVDTNDITTHPFFNKHFFSPTYIEQHDNGLTYHVHDRINNHHSLHHHTDAKGDHHVRLVTYKPAREEALYSGYGVSKNIHKALSQAVKGYASTIPAKPLTESLVSKKPATASKLFAEAMEARLDEISKKTLGSYAIKAVQSYADQQGEVNRKRELANKLNDYNHNGSSASKKKSSELSDILHDEIRKHDSKRLRRGKGLITALNKLTKEDLDEVEAPTNFWNAGMARMNPIQVSQKQPAEPGQFKATLTKSPKRLADQGPSLEGKPKAVRDETEETATSRGPKTIELTGDWHADVPDHDFDPKLDSETEFYPLFSQFKAMGAYPSGPARAWESEEIDEEELNEISKKTLASYATKAVDELGISANVAGGATGANHYQKHLEMLHAKKRARGIKKAVKKLSEDSASLMATATKDEKKAAEQDKKKPAEFKKLHDKHETEVKSKMKELGEEALNEISKELAKRYSEKAQTNLNKHADEVDKLGAKADYHHDRAEHYIHNLKSGDREKFLKHQTAADKLENKISKEHSIIRKREKGLNRAAKKLSEDSLEEGLFDPAKQPLLALWDEHARRSDAHGSGSRNEILKRIEDHVAKKHGQEGLKKMRLHSDLSNALKNSVSGDKGHLQALLGNMRAKCAMEQ